MNYLAHGYRFLDRPLYMAGTVVPDWLSVVNRRVRARSKLVKAFLETTHNEQHREIAEGIMRHHADDHAFHTCEPFMQMESEIAKHFRAFMPGKYDHRPSFLGHIVVELMLDATLAATNQSLLDQFYEVMARVDEQIIEDAVNQIATRPTDKLAWFIERFRQERFLDDYETDEGMFFRLNQVLKRVKLAAMPSEALVVLAAARTLLAERYRELLDIVEGHGENDLS